MRRSLFLFCFALLLVFPGTGLASEPIPVPGMVTMLDLGAGSCVPCKMMAPILEKLEAHYAGRAAIRFIDVWKNREVAASYGIQAIPTQIFYDRQGKERERHTGFLDEESIRGKIDALMAE